MATFLKILGALALVVLSSLWHGWVITVLWRWFVVPTFHLPTLSIAAAIGLGLLVSLMSKEFRLQDEDTDWSAAIATSMMVPAMLLGIGWVVQHWM